jgi:hypothetical protein
MAEAIQSSSNDVENTMNHDERSINQFFSYQLNGGSNQFLTLIEIESIVQILRRNSHSVF